MLSIRGAAQKRLLGLSGVVLISVIVALGVMEIYLDYRKTIEDAFLRLENLARIADESISGRMRTIDIMLQDVGQISQTLGNTEDETAFVTYMRARAASLEAVRTISTTNASGIIDHTTLPELKGFDASQRPYFTELKNAADEDALFIYGPYKAVTGAVVLLAAHAKPRVEGHWDGVAVSSLPPAYFAPIMESVRPVDAGFASLLGTDGTIIAGAYEPGTPQSDTTTPQSAHAMHVASGARMSRAFADTDSGTRNLMVSRMTNYPTLVVAVGWPKDVVLAGWWNRSLTKGGVLFLLGLMAGVVLRQFAKHETDLRAERNFAGQLIETANVAVIGMDRDSVVRVCNEAAERITGFTREELIGRPWFATAGFPSKETATAVAEFQSGKPLPRQFDSAIRTKSGETRLMSWQNSAVEGQEVVSMSFGIDMTERTLAERELMASQRFVQAIADNVPGLVGYWDANLVCRFANKQYLDWFGKPAAQIIGQSMRTLLGDALFNSNSPHIYAVLRGERQRFERILNKPNSEPRYTWAHYIPDIDPSGRVLGFYVLVTDITSLKRTENSLREISERLALATEAGGIGVWLYDVASQRLTWDERMFEMYDIDPQTPELAFDAWANACHPADLERVKGEMAAAIEHGAKFETEFRLRTSTGSGSVRYIKSAGMVRRNAAGVAESMIGVNWDITVIRENELALQATQQAAEQASRAKSDFLANMSHEIRTPMNAIQGLAYLLERSPLNADQSDLLVKIKTASRSLLAIINDILDFSKVEAGRLELEMAEFRLGDLLDALSTIMSINAHGKDLELTVGAAADTPPAFIGDALRLQQVLINLASNAIKFTEKGAVSLHVQQVGESDGKALIRFTVRDTGIGIAPDILKIVFSAFTQADSSMTRRFGGTGLGLAISKRLVELMGGQIGAESVLGQGSSFSFTVPLTPISKDNTLAKGAATLAVLIADDHEVARDVLAVTATSLGWKPDTAASGREALASAQERLRIGSPYDVLVLDWKMPEIDGLAVANIVRGIAGLKQSPLVIMVTAHNREDLLHATGANAVDAVLVKPVTGSALFNAVLEARSRRAGTGGALVDVAPLPAGGPRLAGLRLLVAEDNSINQNVARRVLELDGAVVTVVDDGQQAVDLLTQDAEAFDAVLMDVQMPVMDGYAATRYIRETLRLYTLPILALTAGALETERAQAYKVGMNDFITKPLNIDEMINAIHRAVGVRQSLASDAAKPVVIHESRPLSAAADLLAPDVAGIDMAQAALRLGGDRPLFISLLTRLTREFAETAAQVRAELSAGDTDAAARRLHTVRGAAGNVAAVAVAQAATEAENAIRAGQPAAAQPHLDRLAAELAALQAAVRAVDVPAPSPIIAPISAVPVDQGSAAKFLAGLESRSMSALEAFERLRPALAQQYGVAEIDLMAQHIDNLAFDRAASQLKRLMQP
jgi:two-component system, sensor histidine kinase and response regulator